MMIVRMNLVFRYIKEGATSDLAESGDKFYAIGRCSRYKDLDEHLTWAENYHLQTLSSKSIVHRCGALLKSVTTCLN